MKEIYRGDIWTVCLNPIIGSEQGGTRPALILQNNVGNHHSPTVIIAPITGRKKKNMPTHVLVTVCDESGNALLPKESTILLEQIRTVDKKRIQAYVGKITAVQMQAVEQAIDISLGKKRRIYDE